MSKSQFAANPDEEIRRAFTLYAMDFTAKEATKAALKQNGLEMALLEEEEDAGMWGDIDTIRLLDEETQEPLPGVYESTEEAIDEGGWTPGQGFDFVVRQVPAKIRELSLDELLQALDPAGNLREEAKAANLTLPDEEIRSLRDLANDNVRRSEYVPRGATSEEEAFAGIDSKRGYTPISRSKLLSRNEDGTEDRKSKCVFWGCASRFLCKVLLMISLLDFRSCLCCIHQTSNTTRQSLNNLKTALMHVMDAMVSHGALIVDVTDGGSNFEVAKRLAKMWECEEVFFDTVNKDGDAAAKLPPMTTVMETGSQTAKVGYASCDNDSMQFLETRRDRQKGTLLPEEARSILGEEGTEALIGVFDAVSEIGKSIVRIAVAASSLENGAFDDIVENASRAAAMMADELLDDGRSDSSGSKYSVCMSPHRLCSYTNNQLPAKQEENDENMNEVDAEPQSSSREVFGAHTDSTWVTIVPVAAVSGLEVFDEAAEEWYRPELAARRQWEKEQKEQGKDPKALTETVDGISLPWHCRYVVMMPGELLQLATRNEIAAAVHRVVATKDCPSRLSAPILLRCRPGVKMDVPKYLGGSLGDSLLDECDGMTIEEIHDALQPTTFQ